MTINISFDFTTDMDKFYDNIVNNLPDIVRSAHVEVQHKNVVLAIDPFHEDTLDVEKVLVNDIKQYLRDNEIPYNMTV
jgi:3-deoxy-D-arabino-heptulosonate 7-phosphate (DAHP) synthase class II